MTHSSDIVERLRRHVINRGGAALQNGAWDMMLEAAQEIEGLRLEHQCACQELAIAIAQRDEALAQATYRRWMIEDMDATQP